MKNAKVIDDRDFPFLANATELPKLTIVIRERPQMEITSIENGFLADYPTLYGFYLRNVSIKVLKRGLFDGVNRVNVIAINKCARLSKIENGTFERQFFLKTIFIEDNKAFLDVEPDLFRGLKNVRTLSLFNNSIRAIHKHLFTNTVKLETLILDLNNIKIKFIAFMLFACTHGIKHHKSPAKMSKFELLKINSRR